MLFAQVNPSPAAPLVYQAVLHPPLRSEHSVSHTLRLVGWVPDIPLVYVCAVMTPIMLSTPAFFRAVVMVD